MEDLLSFVGTVGPWALLCLAMALALKATGAQRDHGAAAWCAALAAVLLAVALPFGAGTASATEAAGGRSMLGDATAAAQGSEESGPGAGMQVADQASPDDAAQASAQNTASDTADPDRQADAPTSAGIGTLAFGNDALWSGKDAFFSNIDFANDLLAVGYDFEASDVSVQGSVRAAGYSAVLRDSEVAQSVTLAGHDVTVSNVQAQAVALAGYTVGMQGGTAGTVALAGNDVTFSGEADELYAYGETVTVSGTVHGDVHAEGVVTVAKDARIEGALYVTSSERAQVAEGAQVAHTEVNLVESDDTAFPANTSDLAASMLPTGPDALLNAVLAVVSAVLVALACEWLARRRTAQAATLARTRTGALIGSGVLGALLAPIAFVLLCCLVVTLPLAFALALGLVCLTLLGTGFAATVLAKLAFPRMNRFGAAGIMGAVLGLASWVPVLGMVITIAGFVFTLGCALQAIYLGMRKDAQDGEPQRLAEATTSAAE